MPMFRFYFNSEQNYYFHLRDRRRLTPPWHSRAVYIVTSTFSLVLNVLPSGSWALCERSALLKCSQPNFFAVTALCAPLPALQKKKRSESIYRTIRARRVFSSECRWRKWWLRYIHRPVSPLLSPSGSVQLQEYPRWHQRVDGKAFTK